VVDLKLRGYNLVYRKGETNYCPGCGRTHWYVGRATAECGFCGTPLPLETPITFGNNHVQIVERNPAVWGS
jgi:hypothetical protein